MVKTTVLSSTKKVVKWDKKLEIYTNGLNNNYPEEMELLRNSSVTATMCSILMTQYLLGRGYGTYDDILIGDNRLIDIADDMARDIVDNKGVFIHANINANYDYSDFKIIPFNHCRLGLKDSRKYNGKILVSEQWGQTKVDVDKISVIDVFNPDKTVIAAQVEACKGKDLFEKIANYKGQIFFYNMDRRYYYPLARIEPVWMECDNEHLSSKYKNGSFRQGFFGKTLIITRPLVDNNLVKAAEGGDKEAINDLRGAESERKAFKEGISEFIGVDNLGNAMHVELEFAGDKIEEAIAFKNIESNIDDKMFEYSEGSALDKILMAHNNVPKLLITLKDNAVFGQSGESINAAKETYWENTFKERDIVTRLMTSFIKRINGHEAVILAPIPLLVKEISKDDVLVEKQKAQAQLKGSVGGVTALLAIQTAVSAGTTTADAAIAIIEEIFGIETAVATRMLGNPVKAPTNII